MLRIAACKLLPLIIVVMTTAHTASGQDGRYRVTINDAWRFSTDDAPEAARPNFDDGDWQRVHLPHTWNADDAFDKERSYRRGIGWYRRTLRLDESLEGRRVFLYFEGANQVANVYVNGREIGEHIGGYTAFAFDITDALHPGEDNLLTVRVDNRHDDDIPPLNADFTFYGGIYRDVWLIATDPVHVDILDHASPGIFIDTPRLAEGIASVRIRGSIVNDADTEQEVEIHHRVLDYGRRDVAIVQSSRSIGPGERATFDHSTDPIPDPRLWSPDDPYLYTVRTEIRQGHRILDAVENFFGLRWVEVDSADGFRLNGERLKLIGTNRHQDYPGLGNALSDLHHRRDVELVKETGFNFLRTAHYPQDPAVLEAADRLGLIVWEETPIVNIITMSDAFDENSERMLVEMIRQHYNHPSIAFWGYMNEVMLREPDPIPEGYYDRLVNLAQRLEDRLKEEDPHRTSVTAISLHEIDNGTGFGDIPDVHGMNLYFGWYYDDLSTWGTFLDSLHAERPDRLYLVSEYGAGSDERVHTTDAQAFDFSSEYIQDFHMAALPQLLERDFIIGTGVWNQFDFGSNHRQDTKNGLNQKGLFFYDRTPKDVWHYYRAILLDEPVLHIAREWLQRGGITPSDRTQRVRVFSNCDEVAFRLNERPVASHRTNNAHIDLRVELQPGINVLRAIGTCSGGEAVDEVRIDFKDYGQLFSRSPRAGDRLALNLGAHYAYTDDAGIVWLADTATDAFRIEGGISRRTHHRMHGTIDDPLFQSYREGATSVHLDVADGVYSVELGIVEPAFDEPAQRVFDIQINGEVMAKDVDLSAEHGRWRAARKRFLATADQRGGLRIELVPNVGEPILSSLLIERK